MPIAIYPKGEEKCYPCTEAHFRALFNVQWFDGIEWRSSYIRWRAAIAHRLSIWRKWVHPRQKWLGHYFAQEIVQGTTPSLAISWVSEKLGYGLFAEKRLAPNTYIGEYAGVVRMRPFIGALKNHYLFEYFIADGLTAPFVIDARKKGNHVRFINHSASANAESASAWVNGRSRIIIVTNREVAAGEQLCYDYGPDYWRRRRKPIALD